MVDMNERPIDKFLSKAFVEQKKEGFPESRLLLDKVGDDSFDGLCYASQMKSFTHDEGLSWRIIIMRPIETLAQDTIIPDDGLFPFLIAPPVVGFIVCLLLFVLFMKNQSHKEIIFSDWRFMGAFLFGFVLLNLACFTLIGPNTDALCLT